MRSDERSAQQLRPTTITPNFLMHAEGSVLIETGSTRVICAASVEDRVPQFLRITGAFVALALAIEKLRERDVLKIVPITDYVAATSVGIVDGEPLLDLAYEDDSRAEVDMNIVKTGDGRFVEVQGTAEAIPFGREALLTLLDLADAGIRELVEKQRAIVGHLVSTRQ